MKILAFALVALLLLSKPVLPQHQMNLPPEKPRLVVQIIVCQMRYDYLLQYSDKFGGEGFRLLISEGTVCRNARFNYLLTQSHPGAATIATGTTPSIHGIVSNSWFSRSKEERINSVSDERVSTIGGSYFQGKYSPKNLITSTIGDELRISSPNSKVFGVALEPAHAILLSGHNAHGAFWFDQERGNWITSSHYMDSLPKWVLDFNGKALSDLYLSREWTLVNPIKQYTEADTTRVLDSQSRSRLRSKLNALVRGIVPQKKTRSYSGLLENPFGISLTKDFAIATIVGQNLGKDEHTDFLAIAFTPTRNIGQIYGPGSVELEDTYIRLDSELAHFISFLNSEIGRQNYLLILTSDQGASSAPTHIQRSKIPGGFFEPHKSMALLGSYLNIVYGTGNWVRGYHEKQIYLNQRLIEDSNLSLADFQQRVASFMLQFTGVANAVTGTTLQSSNFTSGILEKFQNSYNPRRSGDVIINLEPGWVENSGTLSSSNSPYSYDTHVPLIWYGWKVRRRQIHTPVNMWDIAPTLSSLIGIGWPNASTGTPIKELIE